MAEALVEIGFPYSRYVESLVVSRTNSLRLDGCEVVVVASVRLEVAFLSLDLLAEAPLEITADVLAFDDAPRDLNPKRAQPQEGSTHRGFLKGPQEGF